MSLELITLRQLHQVTVTSIPAETLIAYFVFFGFLAFILFPAYIPRIRDLETFPDNGERNK